MSASFEPKSTFDFTKVSNSTKIQVNLESDTGKCFVTSSVMLSLIKIFQDSLIDRQSSTSCENFVEVL